MTVRAGDPVPDFQAWLADSQDIQRVRFHDLLGDQTVVLALFPFAFSSTCREQLHDLRDHREGLEAMGVRTYGLSTDSPYTLGAWTRQERFGFPLLSDWNEEAVTALGLRYDDRIRGLEGPAKRATVVVDRDRCVRWVWRSEDPDEVPEMEELLAALAPAATD